MRTIINRFAGQGFVSMRWCSLLVLVLASLSASCAYQPWSIETYIQSLERPERDEYQQPAKVMEALNLTPGMVVADVGAGSGYFTRRIAKAVGETGKVLAIDVEQNMLDYNKQELEKLGMANRAQFVLVKPGACKIKCVTGYHHCFINEGGVDDHEKYENRCAA